MWDARAGHRSLKRPVTRGIFKHDICCPPSPDQLVFSEGRRQAPFFARVSSVPKWAVPFLRLGAERTRTGRSGPGVVLGSSRQFVTSFLFHIFTAKGGEPKKGRSSFKIHNKGPSGNKLRVALEGLGNGDGRKGGFSIVHMV